MEDTDKPQEKGQKKIAKHDSGAADMEKVTDYAEEREILAQDISGAINLIESRRNKEAAERLAKEKELAKVSIRKEDVEILVKEDSLFPTLHDSIVEKDHLNLNVKLPAMLTVKLI